MRSIIFSERTYRYSGFYAAEREMWKRVGELDQREREMRNEINNIQRTNTTGTQVSTAEREMRKRVGELDQREREIRNEIKNIQRTNIPLLRFLQLSERCGM